MSRRRRRAVCPVLVAPRLPSQPQRHRRVSVCTCDRVRGYVCEKRVYPPSPGINIHVRSLDILVHFCSRVRLELSPPPPPPVQTPVLECQDPTGGSVRILRPYPSQSRPKSSALLSSILPTRPTPSPWPRAHALLGGSSARIAKDRIRGGPGKVRKAPNEDRERNEEGPIERGPRQLHPPPRPPHRSPSLLRAAQLFRALPRRGTDGASGSSAV